ncbi:MAG: hypothetical protein R2761_08265 [Acidimicrobiales bacterium]
MTAPRADLAALVAAMTYEIVPLRSASDAIAALPPGAAVSITCSPVKGIDATLELSARVRSAGHTPVPHLAARMVDGPAQVARIAAWLRTEGVDRIFLVAGDAEHPAGPYPDGLSLLRALLDADPALTEVGVPGYPDGHPLIPAPVLAEALMAKQAVLAEAGLRGHVSTQMCFDPERITSWVAEARAAGLTLPVHVGVPGVIDRAKLMTMGVRLGVGASLRYLRKNRRALGSLLSAAHYDPATLLEPLAPHLGPLAIDGIHCFTFNQVAATAAWQARWPRSGS